MYGWFRGQAQRYLCQTLGHDCTRSNDPQRAGVDSLVLVPFGSDPVNQLQRLLDEVDAPVVRQLVAPSAGRFNLVGSEHASYPNQQHELCDSGEEPRHSQGQFS